MADKADITPTAERLRELLDYDPITGTFTRRFRPDRHPSWNSRRAGKITNYLNARGYSQIRVDEKLYLGHRLAWLYVHSEWPPEEIDHVNGDTADNRIENLRLASRSQNLGNARLRRDNKVRLKGVTYLPKLGKWRATIRANGKTRHLGTFDNPKSAHAAYCDAAKRIFQEFANSG